MFLGLPKLIQNLIVASKNGQFEKNESTIALLDGISTCLKNGSARGRRLNDTERAFYGMLLNSGLPLFPLPGTHPPPPRIATCSHLSLPTLLLTPPTNNLPPINPYAGSPWAHKFVSNNLFGPHVRTSQRTRAAFEHKLVELDITHASLVGLKVHLTKYNLEGVPGIISEDATTALRRLDFELLETTTAQSAWDAGVKLWGFDGGCTTVHSIAELRTKFKATSLAPYVYVYTWVPILPNVPWFPFAIIATNNKFDGEWLFSKWRLMHRSCAELGLMLAGHVSDGDPLIPNTLNPLTHQVRNQPTEDHDCCTNR